MPHVGPVLKAPTQLSDLLKAGLENRPDDPALVSMEGVWSWSDLDDAARRLAGNYLSLATGWPR